MTVIHSSMILIWMWQKEVHAASELPATVQAEQLINRMEFHRTVYDSDERNLIMNHAYKLDDMYATTSLAHSLAEQKDDLPLLLETIRRRRKKLMPFRMEWWGYRRCTNMGILGMKCSL